MPGWAMGMRLEEIKPTFDVFSLSKVLWAMVTGKRKLRLWYHDQPEFDPEKLFPQDPAMHWIKRLLAKTVVEHEEGCLDDASQFLQEVDRTLQALRFGAQHMGTKVQRVCLVCGLGEYKLLWDETNYGNDNRFGPPGFLIGHSKTFRCTNCGHVQLFMTGVDATPPAWRD
jgi:hypothetical protein